MKKILGISAYYHDSAAALVIGNQIIAAAQEERFTRVKHTAEFPKHAISYCLEEAGVSIDELDVVVFYDKPFLKFERLLETYLAYAPKGVKSFVTSIPIWTTEKLFLKKKIRDGLSDIQHFDKKKLRILFSEHHLSHAASSFFASNFTESAILTIDGVGEYATTSIGIGKNNSITFLKEMHFPDSVGLLYSAFTYYLGFTVNSGEYKLMGLAPYGNPNSEEVKHFVESIKQQMVCIKDDGSIQLTRHYFDYAVGFKMANEKEWEKLFGFPRRKPESPIEQWHCNLAFAIQYITEEIVLKMATEAKKITGSDTLCLAGGVALNCVSNGKLLRSKLFKSIYIQPASGDAGGALGAALAVAFIYFDQERHVSSFYDKMKGAYLGPSYSEKEIHQVAKKTKAVYSIYNNQNELLDKVAADLTNGKVIGWFQGRMEFGPRALGNRSILADAANPEMQMKINLKIKFREGFRPFAPAVPIEDVSEYFNLEIASPYMLLVDEVNPKKRLSIPNNYNELPLFERLYTPRSIIQSITHIDFSARVQTVHPETNLLFYDLLKAFKRNRGSGVLINTSFNVRGEPVVCDPNDAYRCFMQTDMDVLVMGSHYFIKEHQPDYENKEKWNTAFALD